MRLSWQAIWGCSRCALTMLQDMLRKRLLRSQHTWAHLLNKNKAKSMRSGPFVNGVQRPRLSSSEKAHTLNLTQLIWRALFFQTSKFRPSHCQRRHTELNEAAGWTNTANRIALTTNMAHIMLNYGPRHDWTHIQTGEAALRMARILNAIYQEHRGAKFLWEMFVFLLFYFFPLFVQILPLRTLWTLTH